MTISQISTDLYNNVEGKKISHEDITEDSDFFGLIFLSELYELFSFGEDIVLYVLWGLELEFFEDDLVGVTGEFFSPVKFWLKLNSESWFVEYIFFKHGAELVKVLDIYSFGWNEMECCIPRGIVGVVAHYVE